VRSEKLEYLFFRVTETAVDTPQATRHVFAMDGKKGLYAEYLQAFLAIGGGIRWNTHRIERGEMDASPRDINPMMTGAAAVGIPFTVLHVLDDGGHGVPVHGCRVVPTVGGQQQHGDVGAGERAQPMQKTLPGALFERTQRNERDQFRRPLRRSRVKKNRRHVEIPLLAEAVTRNENRPGGQSPDPAGMGRVTGIVVDRLRG